MYNGAESYFEDGVLSADPVELVRMLYRGGIDAVEKARQHLREGDIAARSAQISRAGAIIAHLTFSVNRDADPSMGANLGARRNGTGRDGGCRRGSVRPAHRSGHTRRRFRCRMVRPGGGRRRTRPDRGLQRVRRGWGGGGHVRPAGRRGSGQPDG